MPDLTSDLSNKYVIGVDYGTLSGRALLVRVSDGEEIATAVYEYPHAVVEEKLPTTGAKLPPDWALQVPSDYVDVLKVTVPAVLKESGIDPKSVIGITTDFTACTILPVKSDGTPLCELPEFSKNPHAFVKLWKHHSAQPHADRITNLAHQRKETWISRYGGKISSEWEFAKAATLLSQHLSQHAYLANNEFSAADIVCTSILQWAHHAGFALDDILLGYMNRLSERPALDRKSVV